MWSSVNEQITDGTSGLASNSQVSGLILGTASKSTIGTSLTLGKKSSVSEILGYGEMPRRIIDMQKTMADVSVLALRTEGDCTGTISQIETLGNINITVTGTSLCQSSCDIAVYTAGNIGQAELKILISGDLEKTEVLLIPEDGIVTLDTGITIMFPTDIAFTEASKWSFLTTAPTSSFEVIEQAISEALEIHTPEFIVIAQSVDADFVKKLGVLSERLFEDHKPVLLITETNLSLDLPLSEAISKKKEEFSKIEARFVSVVCQPLENRVSSLGLCAGHITKSQVNQSIGATNYYMVTDVSSPRDWTNIHSRALDESRFITLRTYAGLNNLFWSNGRTMAGDTSDYRYIEVVRTVFKAIRLARRASLPYIQSAGNEVGLENLLTEVRSAIDGMVTSTKKELDDYNVEMPKNQDVVNNGVVLNIELFGIPIIRKIVLNFSFRYNKSE